MKTTRNQIENLIAEVCKLSGMKNNRTDAVKAGKEVFLSYGGSNGWYSLYTVNVVSGSISKIFDTPYSKQVLTLGELRAHLTGILAALRAFTEAYSQTLNSI